MAKNQLDGTDYRIIRELANNGMKIPKVAPLVYLERTAIYYRCEKIKRITGLDPMDFWDLLKLYRKFEGVAVDA